MTRDEASRIRVCYNCKWCKQETVENAVWTRYDFKCTNSITSVDPVTGDENYLRCRDINREGKCGMFERKRSFLDKLFRPMKERENGTVD